MKELLLTHFILASSMSFAQSDTTMVYYEDGRIEAVWNLRSCHPDSCMPLFDYRNNTQSSALLVYRISDTIRERETASQFWWYDHFQSGSMTSYYRNGEVERIMHFRNGRIHGPYVQFHPNGRVKIQGQFSLNAKTGVWTEYFKTGTVKSRGAYYDSVLVVTPLEYLGVDSTAYFQKDHQLLFYLKSASLENQNLLDSLSPDVGNEKRFLSIPNCVYFRDGEWEYFNADGTVRETQAWRKGGLVE